MNRKMAKAARTAALAIPTLAPGERRSEPAESEFPEEAPVSPLILDDAFEVLDVWDWDEDVVVE
jgi:hypothetical protein